MKLVGAKIATARRRRGMGYGEIASDMRCLPATQHTQTSWVRMVETREMEVTEPAATALAATLGVGLSELCDPQRDPQLVLRVLGDELGEIAQRLAKVAADLGVDSRAVRA